MVRLLKGLLLKLEILVLTSIIRAHLPTHEQQRTRRGRTHANREQTFHNSTVPQ